MCCFNLRLKDRDNFSPPARLFSFTKVSTSAHPEVRSCGHTSLPSVESHLEKQNLCRSSTHSPSLQKSTNYLSPIIIAISLFLFFFNSKLFESFCVNQSVSPKSECDFGQDVIQYYFYSVLILYKNIGFHFFTFRKDVSK